MMNPDINLGHTPLLKDFNQSGSMTGTTSREMTLTMQTRVMTCEIKNSDINLEPNSVTEKTSDDGLLQKFFC